jgi:hypothetical protein
MEPAEAARTLTDALAKETNSNARGNLAEVLAAVAGRMEPAEATKVYTHAANALTDALPKITNSDPLRMLAVLTASSLGIAHDALNRSQHATILASGAFATPQNFLPSLPLLHPYFQPQPRPLPPQSLVELLKYPFCIRGARRAVLDALEFTYKRPFKDLWDFVEYAQQHQPQLDLLTPPKRPQP